MIVKNLIKLIPLKLGNLNSSQNFKSRGDNQA